MPLLLLLAAADPNLGEAMRNAIDPCRKADPAEGITVCGKQQHDQAQSRYRLPSGPDRGFDPLGSVESVSRSRNRLIDGSGASQDLTRGSCSAVGLSGSTGCQVKRWQAMDQQKGW